MERRSSNSSHAQSVNSHTGFITPQNSTAESHNPPRQYTGASDVPAYTENPYNPNTARHRTVEDHQSVQTSYHDPHQNVSSMDGDAENALPRSSQQSPRRPSTSASERRGITSSLRSFIPFRRNSRSSDNSQNKNTEGSSTEKESAEKDGSEKPTGDVEEHEVKAEDPEHLLNTILEEPEDYEEEQMMPVSDAAAGAVLATDLEAHPEVKQRRQGYRENLMRQRRLRKYSRASRTVSTLRRAYRRVISLSLFTRSLVYWFPLALILFIPLACGFWQNPNLEIGGTRVSWLFIWLEVVWGALFVGKLFAHYMPEVIGFFLSIFFPRYFKYVNMFLSLELAVQLLIWTFITFISFPPILTANSLARDKDKHPHQPHWQQIIQDICVALLVSAIVFLVEQIFMYVLSTNFHRTRMKLRIDNQKKSVNVLIILLDKAYSFFPHGCDEFAEEDENLQYATLKRATKKVGEMKAKGKVFDKMKNTVNLAAHKVSGMVADVAAGSKDNEPPSCAKIVKNALTNRQTREVLASRIWKSLVMEDSTALNYEDLLNTFGADKKEEVLYMFDILDTDGQDGIELDEMIDSVNRIGREAKQISKSLVDINGCIVKLHHLLLCIALILVVVIFVGMLAPSSATVLATLGSTLLSFSFLFSSTAQEVFQSCVFLFVKHPFDVGDWVQTTVPSLGLVRMQVVELCLMYSVFNQIGVGTRRQVSNSVLNAQFIDNISRSGPSQISIILLIGIPETTSEQLEEFEFRLNEFVDLNPRDYCPGVFFQAVDQTDLDRLSLNICINTRNSQDDIVLFSRRRTRALEFIGQCIHDIPISIPHREDTSFHDPSLPIFQYNIKDIDEAMQYVEKTKGKRRTYGMYPPKEDVEEAASVAVTEHGDAYVDAPQRPTSATVAPTTTRTRRQFSFSSKASQRSRNSHAFSTTSQFSQTHGLRSRFQKPGQSNVAQQ